MQIRNAEQSNNRKSTAAALSLAMLVAILLGLAACGGGGGSSSSFSESSGGIAGNWQFTVTGPSDNSFTGGVQGGFLLQKDKNVSGALTYAIYVAQGGNPVLCNSGSAPITGTLDGKNVKLTALAGGQTFSFTGTLGSDGKTISGTYSSTDNNGCGTEQSGLQWSAQFVPPLNGAVEGNIHSFVGTPIPPFPPFGNQSFPVTGNLVQGENIGASNATVTGTLYVEGYPCFDLDLQTNLATISVNGQISGNRVILQVFGLNGLNAGQIGAAPNSLNPLPGPVILEGSAQKGGLILHGTNGYGISSTNCPGGNTPGDYGDICFALGGANDCNQPVLFSPALVTFPPKPVGTYPVGQTITLTNNDPLGTALENVTLKLTQDTGPFAGPGDFTGLPHFIAQDTCASAPGQPFTLGPQKSCTITVSFSPQQSCPWLPFGKPSPLGVPPEFCPFPLNAKLTLTTSDSEGNPLFSVPITGYGMSALVSSTPELDFGAQALGQHSPPQSVSFLNQADHPVQILPYVGSPCVNPDVGVLTLPRPLAPGKGISGFQVLTPSITPNVATIDYLCDSDLTSKLPNFQISADNCSGRVLAPQESCSLQVSYAPQPTTPLIPALDYFLELDTMQCTDDVTSNCEVDSGRFPVELKANMPSSLRMTPGAGLDFGEWPLGQVMLVPLTITLFNDPDDPNAGPVTFTANQVKGDYTELNDCGAVLDSGSSCTLSIFFKPKILGFEPGTITLGTVEGSIQTIYLRGTGVEPLP
jgi:hypothetical protein